MSKSLQVLGRCSSDETINAGGTVQIVLFTSIETDGSGTLSQVEIPVSVDATLSDLGIKITANSLDDDCVFTLSKNTTETSLQVTVSSTSTGWFTDDTNTVSVATSTTTPDKISIKVDASAASSGSISFSVAHLVYEPDDAGETLTIYGCNRSGNVNMSSASTTYRFTPHGSTGSNTSNATDMQRVSRIAGDLKFFTAWAAVNQRTTDVDFVVNVDGSDGNNTLNFTSSDITLADYTSTDTVSVGDEIYYKGDTGTGTEAFTLESIGSQIVTSDDKFALTSGSTSGEVTSEGTTEYIPLGGELDEGFATEAEAEVTLPFDMDFLELFADLRSVLSDTSSTINLRVNGVTEMTVTPTAAGEFTDTGTISASAGDTACIQIITATGGGAFRPYEIVVVAQEAGGDTDVAAGPEALTLTTNDATIALDVEVSSSTEALTLTTYTANVAADNNITASNEALTLTTNAASVAFDVDVSASPEALTLTTYSATVSADTGISASTEGLALTTYGASVAFDVNVSAGVEALTLTTYPATLSADVNISANTEDLTLASYAASIALDVDVSANNEALTLATYSATISADLNINANVEALTLTTFGAAIAYDVDIAANTEGLTLTTFIASVSDGTEFDISASAESLTLTAYTATIFASSEFTFPVVDNFSGLWITDPLDKIQVLETDGAEKPAYAFDDGYIQHAQPIQLDRYANIPSIYFDSGDCQVKLYNKHGVEKYSITRTSGTWYVGGITGISVDSAFLTLSTYQARINNSINPAPEQLTLSTYTATVDHT